ncbi:hypothetical protein HDU93_003586 [Gonapodya sp. JEL0774]|nr:hypothetical protein HDU93_003586 [Gonapodya sp. JEL0774]
MHHDSALHSVDFTTLPNEVLLLIGEHLPFRLGLPTESLNKRLVAVFRTPDNIATRAIARYASWSDALVSECYRTETDQPLVIMAMRDRLSRDEPDFDLYTLGRVGPKGPAWTPLEAAAVAGNIDLVRLLLSLGVDVSGEESCRPGLPLATVCAEGNVQIAKLLLENGANVDAGGNFALCQSCKYGHVDVVKFLLSKGANVDNESHEGRTPLEEATDNGHLHVVSVLLDHGADVHVGEDRALSRSSEAGHIDIVRLLLFHGANPNAGSLQIAALFGHTEVVSLLLDNGADVHRRENAALWNGVLSGERDVVKLLLERGANAGGDSVGRRTVFGFAEHWGLYTKLLELVAEHSRVGI